MSAPPAALSADAKFYYSGPSGGPDDNRKFNTGGTLATPLVPIVNGVNYNWFPDVSRTQMTWVSDNQYWYQYACYILKNTSTTGLMTSPTLSVSNTLLPSDNIVAIGVSLKNATPVSIANVNTAPVGITFKEKVGGVLPTIALSDISPGEFYAVWVRLRGLHGKPLFKFAHIKTRLDWIEKIVEPPPPPPTSWVNFQDSTGPILSPARILLLYPGGSWDTAKSPSMDDINNAVKALCTGTYFSQLSQYRNIAVPTWASADTLQDNNSDLHSTFTDTDMRTIINNWIDGHNIDAPTANANILYVVFPDHTAHRDDSKLSGHSAYTKASYNVHYCWSDTGDGLDFVMQRLSKELVNSISNPEPSGTVGTPAIESKDGTHKSLADWCTGTGTSSGVKVGQYYSENNAACIAP